MDRDEILKRLAAIRENLRVAKSHTRSQNVKLHILMAMLEIDQLHINFMTEEKGGNEHEERNHCGVQGPGSDEDY